MKKQPSTLSLDWWMHELYQSMKAFIYNPSEEMQKRLVSSLDEYRKVHKATHAEYATHDEHEHVMDFR